MASSTAEIVARLTMNAAQFSSETARVYGDLEKRAADSATRTQAAFTSSYSEIERLGRKAAEMPRNASGAVNVDAAGAQMAAAAATRQAEALREIAVASELAARAQGDNSENTRLYVQASRAAAIEAENNAKGATQQAAALDRLQAQLDETAAAARKASGANVDLDDSFTRANRGARGNSQAMIQAGQQAQDFFIQVQGGQSVMTAFAQQGSQMAYVLSGIGGKAGAVATVLSGPLGLAALGAISVVGLLANKFMGSGDAADKKKKSVRSLTEALAELDKESRRGIQTQEQAALASLGEARALRETVAENRKLIAAKIELQIKSIEAAKALSLSSPVDDRKFDRLAIAGSEGRLGGLQADLKKARDEVAKADAAVLRKEIPILRSQVAAQLTAEGGAADRARVKVEALNEAYAKGGLSQGDYRRQSTGIETTKTREVDAARDADREANKDKASKKRTDKQVYDAFVGELRREGLVPTSGFRTFEQQAHLFRTLPKGGAARPGTSDHEFYKALDFGPNLDRIALARAARRADVELKPELVHGKKRHLHQAFADGSGGRGGGNGEEDIRRLADKQASDAEKATEALAEAQKRVTEALGASNEELTLAIELGKMRANGMERQADVEEAIARLRAQMLPLIAAIDKGDAAALATAREQLAVRERQTEELVRQGHAAEDNVAADKEIEERRKKEADAAEEAAQYAQKMWDEQADRQRESVSDLADFFEDAFDTGGKSIWKSFKDQGKRALAEMAAQWALSLISGQQASMPSILGQINSPGSGGGNFLSQALGSLFGGRSGGNDGLDAAINATVARNNTALGGGYGGALPGPAGAGITSTASLDPTGRLMASAGLGSLTSGLGSSLGLRQSSFAAGVGGAIGGELGGAFGPLGSAIGSALGGLVAGTIGGLLKSSKRGTATLGFDSYGDLGVTSTRGNSASRTAGASSAVGGVADTLKRIADQLGGSLGGNPSASFGIRDSSFRVDTTGQGRTKGRGVLDFGKDEEAAIRAYVSELLKDGVVQGISDASKRILQSGQELERAIDKAAMIEDIPRRLKARLDPVGQAIDDLNKGWDKAIAALREGGASTEQMADAQRLYKMELEDTNASAGEASASLKAFRDSLNAGSASPLSLRDQERAAEAALKPFLDQITAGERIDQGRYQEAAQAYLDIERQLNGSGAAYFAAFDKIQSATGRAIATIDNATPIRPATDPFAERTATATVATADILSGQSQQLAAIQNLLHGIRDNMGSDNSFIGTSRNFVSAA